MCCCGCGFGCVGSSRRCGVVGVVACVVEIAGLVVLLGSAFAFFGCGCGFGCVCLVLWLWLVVVVLF